MFLEDTIRSCYDSAERVSFIKSTIDLTIDIDRNNFTNTGKIKVDITSIPPLDPLLIP